MHLFGIILRVLFLQKMIFLLFQTNEEETSSQDMASIWADSDPDKEIKSK